MRRFIPFTLAALLALGNPWYGAAAPGDAEESAEGQPLDLLNNQYYTESLRLAALARESFDYGDYDASADYAEESLRYAQLSDEYVALVLKIQETDDAIASARSRLDWAVSVNAAERYGEEFAESQEAYDEALTERAAEEWDSAIDAAKHALDALAAVEGVPPPAPRTPPPLPPPGPSAPPPRTDDVLPPHTDDAPAAGVLPAQYTVRTWPSVRDCLWNIAGRSWVYGDPHKWRVLYNANKAKLPNPNNPDLLEPGLILDIPSIKGEKREGMYDPSRKY